MNGDADFVDDLMELIAPMRERPSKGYLSKRQEAYFKQRRKKPKPGRIGMLQKQYKPHEVAAMRETGLSIEELALASRAAKGDWREGIKKLSRQRGKRPAAPAGEVGEKQTLEQKENLARDKEERAAQRKQQEAMRKRLQQLDDAYRDADTEEKKALIKQQIDALTGQEAPPDLTPEERGEIGIYNEADIEFLEGVLVKRQEMERELNVKMNDSTLSEEKKNIIWGQLKDVRKDYSSIALDKQRIEALVARKSELAAYEQELRRRDRLEEEQRLVDLEREAAEMEAARQIEEMEKRPVETRGEEAERELREETAKAEALTKTKWGGKEPYKIAAQKRKVTESKRKEELAADNQAQKDIRSRQLAGEKGLDAAFLSAIHKAYNKPDKKQQAWLDNRDRIKRELIVYNQQLGQLLREEYAEDSQDVENVKAKILGLSAQLKDLGKMPNKKETLEKFVIRRKKEIDKELKAEGLITPKVKPKLGAKPVAKVETITGKSGRKYPMRLVEKARANRGNETFDRLLFDIGE